MPPPLLVFTNWKDRLELAAIELAFVMETDLQLAVPTPVGCAAKVRF